MRRNQMSAPPQSSAWRSRGNCHGGGLASPTAVEFLRFPPPIAEAVMDALRQSREKLEGADRPARGQKFLSPAADLVDRIGLMAFDIFSKIPQLADAIVDGQGPSGVLEIARRMLETHDALEAQLLRPTQNRAIPTELPNGS